MIEKNISVKSNDITLAGIVCLPSEEGRFSCVLMIHGSGPVDRNENARGAKINAFNTIAHYLAAKGIASLRYDKRGCGESSGNYWETGHYDLIEDGKAMYRYILAQEYINKDLVFLLGHSEGTLIVQKISLEYPDIAGLILLAPWAQNMEQVLIWQANRLKEDFEQGKGIIRRIARIQWKLMGDPLKVQSTAIKKMKGTDKAWFRYKLQKINAKWFREIFSHDPVDTISKVSCPILAIAGDKDIQVDPKDTIRIAELAKGEVEYHIIPNMTHILRLDEQTPSLLHYRKLLKTDMDHSILDIMYDWLQKRLLIRG